jgi:uncharacterized protein YndB with AHSA1/START domain
MRKDGTQIMENTKRNERSIEKNLFIKAPPQRVFQALTEQAELERWYLTKAELDLRPGGAISFEWDRAMGVYNFGKILVLEPPHRLSYTWEALEPSPTTVTYELTAENDGTRLHLTHTGIGEGEAWDHYYDSRNSGWSVHLNNLAAWLETGKATNQIERLQRKATPTGQDS